MLTKKNKRMVRKMKKYIKTFPLTEKEIDQMIEDITGMAEEAQERNENFETVLGKSVHEFCDDLIYSVGGIRAPGGRKLIRGTSIYFQLLGLWGIVIYMGVNLLMYCNEIIIAIDNGKAFLKTSDFPILIIGIIVNFGPAILYLVGARRNRPAGEQIKVENR